MIKLIHTNAFNSTRYNAESKRSLMQKNVCMYLTLRITNTCSMFTYSTTQTQVDSLSKLNTRNLILKNFEDRGSRRSRSFKNLSSRV